MITTLMIPAIGIPFAMLAIFPALLWELVSLGLEWDITHNKRLSQIIAEERIHNPRLPGF
jgi:hypothetical protein